MDTLALTYAGWLSATGVAALATAWVAWRRRPAPGAGALSVLLLAVAEWTLTYAQHWSSADPVTQARWLDLTFIGVVSAPVSVWLMVWSFTRDARPLRTMNWLPLVGVPAVTLALLAAGDPNGLLFGASPDLQAHTRLAGGPWFTVVLVHGYGLMLLSAARLVTFVRTARGVYRKQASLMLAGLLVPWAANVVGVLGLRILPGLDLTPLVFLLTALTFLWSILRARLFDLVPVARHQLVEQLTEGVIVLDLGQRVVDLNATARRILPDSAPDPIGRPAAEAFAPWRSLLDTLDDPASAQQELHTGGLVLAISITPLLGPHRERQGHIVTWRDVTGPHAAREQLRAQYRDIQTLQEQLREQSVRDPLTGLYNRRHLQDALADPALKAYSVILLDIDHFKGVNDTAGHAGGDLVLQGVARILTAALQPGESAYRYGGEEFLLLLPGVTSDLAARRAETIRAGIAAHTPGSGGHDLRVTVSLGVAGSDGQPFDDVLLRADHALYRAKDHGRDRVHVAEDSGGFQPLTGWTDG